MLTVLSPLLHIKGLIVPKRLVHAGAVLMLSLGLLAGGPLGKAGVADEHGPEVEKLANGDIYIRLEPSQNVKAALSDNYELQLHNQTDFLEVVILPASGAAESEKLLIEIETLLDRPTEIRLVDVNFDGMRDMLVQTGVGYGGVNVFFDVYLGAPGGLAGEPAVSGLSNPETDPELKQIFTGENTGSWWYNSIYEVEDGKIYKYMTSTTVGDMIEYAVFFTPDGEEAREMLTAADAADPREWQPIQVTLPEGGLFPLRAEPDDESPSASAIPAESTVILRRMSEDLAYILVESREGALKGWVKTEWLPLPEGLSFDQ